MDEPLAGATLHTMVDWKLILSEFGDILCVKQNTAKQIISIIVSMCTYLLSELQFNLTAQL